MLRHVGRGMLTVTSPSEESTFPRMPVSAEFLHFLLDQLTPLGGISTRRMFGCVALICDGRMFALVSREDRFYVKADAFSRARFVEASCPPFTYTVAERSGATKEVALPYYAPPETVLEDGDELIAWARLGLEAAARAPEKKPRKRRTM